MKKNEKQSITSGRSNVENALLFLQNIGQIITQAINFMLTFQVGKVELIDGRYFSSISWLLVEL